MWFSAVLLLFGIGYGGWLVRLVVSLWVFVLLNGWLD